MKLTILLLFAFVTQTLALAVSRDADVEDLDNDAVDIRDWQEADLETRNPQSGGKPGQPGQPGQPGRPGGGGLPGSCPFRRQAVPWFRRGKYPFPTSSIVGFFFSFKSNAVTVVYFLVKPSTNDFFYTTDSNERNNAMNNLGYQNRGTIGYIFTNQRCGGSPLFRLYNSKKGQHFYTTSQSERAGAKKKGWNDEGITGYVFRN